MKSLHPTLEPSPTAKSFLFTRSKNYAFITELGGVSLLHHWMEAVPSKCNLWHSYFSEIISLITFLKHHTKFIIGSCTF